MGGVDGVGGSAKTPLRWRARRRVAALVNGAIALALRGDRFRCPCCGGAFRRFRPYGTPPRANARCPGCGALERHRAVWLYLRESTDLLRTRHRVLHVAPEDFLQERLSRSPQVDYVSIDLLSPRAMHRMDVTRLDFPDASFDVVFCSHVLEHVRDDGAAMRELLRVLRPGGWAILQTPFDAGRGETDEDPSVATPAQRLRRFGQEDHVRMYGTDLFDRLRAAGWDVTRIRVTDEFGAAAVREGALDPAEELLVGRRRAVAPDRGAPTPIAARP